MTRRAVIELEYTERDDGSVYVKSHDVPLFHVVAENTGSMIDIVLPILKEHLEAKFGCNVKLSIAEKVGDLCDAQPKAMDFSAQHVPAHIIAEVAAH